MTASSQSAVRNRVSFTAVACLLLALATAVYPALRCFARAELTYNEGWNVYNAQTVASGGQLYPAHFGWRVVNYPALSFYAGAALHRLTGTWLLPARLLSLACTFACAWMVAAVLRALGAGRRSAWLGAAFALAIFCISATAYVGVDDPQMLAEAVFMLGLLVYVRRNDALPSRARVATVAALFVVAGCIKHSPLEFPLAVFADLLLLSATAAGWFVLCGALSAAVAVAWNIHFGGPGFVQALTLERGFSAVKSVVMFKNLFGPLLLPACLAGWVAARLRHDPKRRVLGLLLLTGLMVGFAFEGGEGVSVNVWFGAMLAMALLAGWSMHSSQAWLWLGRRQQLLPSLLFAWTVIPAITEQVWNPVELLRQQREANVRYAQELQMLRAHPGPALCESLLRCEEAGKPYLYDPFNATRLMTSGRLPEEPLLQSLRLHQFAAVQLHALPPGDSVTHERFPDAVSSAIQRYYRVALSNEDGFILLPAGPTAVSPQESGSIMRP